MDKPKCSKDSEKEEVIAEILTAPLETDEDYLYLESLIAEEPETDLGEVG